MAPYRMGHSLIVQQSLYVLGHLTLSPTHGSVAHKTSECVLLTAVKWHHISIALDSTLLDKKVLGEPFEEPILVPGRIPLSSI